MLPVDIIKEKLKGRGFVPTRTIDHHESGDMFLVFQVDDNDDRYVEVSTSRRNLSLFVVIRDGWVAEAYVFSDMNVAIDTVERRLKAWTRRYLTNKAEG